MITSSNKEIQALVDDIKNGRLLLPELQRQFVWKSTQVRNLFDSLYHQYPSGQLLAWETNELPYSHALRVDGVNNDQRSPQLLLDGQQRLTSLAAILLARPLIARGVKHPIDIVFNVFTEKFEVAGPRQSLDAGWISLSKLFTNGVLSILTDLKLDTNKPETAKIFDHLNRLEKIKTYNYQVNVLEGLSYDEVTDIFVRINSGGTKLSSADLALAQLSSRWRGVTKEIDDFQNEIYKRGNGLWIGTGILLRGLSAFISGQTRLSQLFKGERQFLTIEQLQECWERLKIALDQAVSFLVGNCSINRMELMPTQYILIPLAIYFDKHKINSPDELRELERWAFMALIWARYSASAETATDQDISAISLDQPIQSLIQNIEDKVGKQRLITEREFRDQRKNSPYMLMAYVLARRNQAHDWFNGVVIDGNKSLELHHIFPKEVLKEKYDLKVDSRTVDQVANLVFLSKRANLKIRSQPPSIYLPTIAPESLRDQYVSLKPELWTLENFDAFVLERRTSLANAINTFLHSLSEGQSLWIVGNLQLLESRVDAIESNLRALIANRLLGARADQAWEIIPTEIRNMVEGKINKHVQEHPYLREKYLDFENKLEFCQFSDYLKIVRSNWSLLKQDFGDQNIFDRHFQEVTDVRNSLKHNRDIPDSKLASAEAGLLWLEDCLNAATIVDDEMDENGNGEEIQEEINENDASE
jgi:hypothetical protein